MKNKDLFIIAFVLCLLSCEEKNKQFIERMPLIDKTISISLLPDISNKLNLSEISDEIELIFLETSDNVLLADINKILIDDDRFFILNSYDKLIYVFDKKGRFINKIGSRGDGPFEVMYPENFTLHKQKKEVYIVDNFQRLYVYKYDGSFVKKIDHTLFFTDFYIQNDSLIYFHVNKFEQLSPSPGGIYRWNLWVKNQETVSLYFPYLGILYPNPSIRFDTNNPFNDNGQLLYHYAFSDTIYTIDSLNLTPLYSIDWNNKKPDINFNELHTEEVYEYLDAHPNDAYYLQNVIDLNDYLRFNYQMGHIKHEVLYNKKTMEVKEGNLINDILGGKIKFMTAENNKLIGYMDLDQVELITDSYKYFDEQIRDQIKNIDIENNPLLLILSLN